MRYRFWPLHHYLPHWADTIFLVYPWRSPGLCLGQKFFSLLTLNNVWRAANGTSSVCKLGEGGSGLEGQVLVWWTGLTRANKVQVSRVRAWVPRCYNSAFSSNSLEAHVLWAQFIWGQKALHIDTKYCSAWSALNSINTHWLTHWRLSTCEALW